MPSNVGNSPSWFGYSLDFWNSVSSKLLVFAVITGTLAAIASGLSSWIGSEVTSRTQDAAGDRISAAELELQRSRERTAALDVAVADANAKAAEANRIAEQERLARVKIEERLAFRVITPVSAQQIQEMASTFAGQPIDIFVAGESQEMSGLALHLDVILANAGWQPLLWVWTGIGSVSGIGILTKRDADRAAVAAADAVSLALNHAGLLAIRQTWADPWERFGGMLNGPTFNADRSQIRLVVGAKPL